MKVKVIEFKDFSDFLDKLMKSYIEDNKCNEEQTCQVKTNVEEEFKPGINFFIEMIAIKKGWEPKAVAEWLSDISNINEQAAFSIVLKEVAIWLDHKYEDHIENSDEVFVISCIDGRIHKLCKKYIKNYRNFAAFRTLEDAKFACKIMKAPLKSMFKGHANRK